MNIWIALFITVWSGLGLIFLGLCRAAGRADEQLEQQQIRSAAPRTLRQHIFAIHARSLRSLRRNETGRGPLGRHGAGRSHLGGPHVHSA